jgi:DNA-binding XRE family transcriptional regulator
MSADPSSNPVVRVRLSTGLTQKQLADVLGVNRVTVARWESGSVTIPLMVHQFFKLIEASPEDALAVLKNGKKIPRAARPKTSKPPVEVTEVEEDGEGFGGAGAPPPKKHQAPIKQSQQDGKDTDAWRFGF